MPTTLHLSDNEGAIIFRAGDGMDVHLPSETAEEGADGFVPEELVAMGMCAVLMSDTAFAASIRAMIRAHMAATMQEEQ